MPISSRQRKKLLDSDSEYSDNEKENKETTKATKPKQSARLKKKKEEGKNDSELEAAERGIHTGVKQAWLIEANNHGGVHKITPQNFLCSKICDKNPPLFGHLEGQSPRGRRKKFKNFSSKLKKKYPTPDLLQPWMDDMFKEKVEIPESEYFYTANDRRRMDADNRMAAAATAKEKTKKEEAGEEADDEEESEAGDEEESDADDEEETEADDKKEIEIPPKRSTSKVSRCVTIAQSSHNIRLLSSSHRNKAGIMAKLTSPARRGSKASSASKNEQRAIPGVFRGMDYIAELKADDRGKKADLVNVLLLPISLIPLSFRLMPCRYLRCSWALCNQPWQAGTQYGRPCFLGVQ